MSSSNNEDRDQFKIRVINSELSEDSSGVNAIQILTAASDIGVRLNKGRNGARYAPEVILNQFNNLSMGLLNGQGKNFKPTKVFIKEVSNQKLEVNDFPAGQIACANKIAEVFKNKSVKKYIHLGGGHDQIYPLLRAGETAGFDQICVINIDAHADTRIDQSPHSGTPFRQFDEEVSTVFKILQYGLHPFANSKSTLSPLKSNHKNIFFNEVLNLSKDEIEKHFSDVFSSWADNVLFIFSLDCDALDSGIMSGVSATNHFGFSKKQIFDLMSLFNECNVNATKVLGLYEYNPIYDDLATSGARYLASLMYQFAFESI
jgi:formiminoglutamase